LEKSASCDITADGLRASYADLVREKLSKTGRQMRCGSYVQNGIGADLGFVKGGADHGERIAVAYRGVWSGAPSGVHGQNPLWGIRRTKPLKLKASCPFSHKREAKR